VVVETASNEYIVWKPGLRLLVAVNASLKDSIVGPARVANSMLYVIPDLFSYSNYRIPDTNRSAGKPSNGVGSCRRILRCGAVGPWMSRGNY